LEYTKPFQTFEELANIVQDRGLGGSREALLFALKTVGYYRLSGYWYPFHTNDVFDENATIESVMRIYDFDRHLRLNMLNAIEHIEVYVRTQLAHKISRDHGAFGYLNESGLPRLSEKDYTRFIEKCHLQFERSREPFVLHYQKVYGEGDKKKLPPLWMMVNAMDFGQIVTLYKGTSPIIRKEIAEEFDVTTKVFESWLLSLNTVRNICAHHGRLWNKVLGTPVAIPKNKSWRSDYPVDPCRLFAVLLVCQYMLHRISPSSSWRLRFDELLDEYPDISRRSMGMTADWEEHPIWIALPEFQKSNK